MGTKHKKQELYIEFTCGSCSITKVDQLSARRPVDILNALTCEKCGLRIGNMTILSVGEEPLDNGEGQDSDESGED